MKLFLPLILFIVVACGTEIGNCSESEEVGIPTECDIPLEKVESQEEVLPFELPEEVPPYEEEPVNG